MIISLPWLILNLTKAYPLSDLGLLIKISLASVLALGKTLN